MKQLAFAGALFLLTVAWMIAWSPPAAKTGEVRLNGRTFTLADGFEIELVAGPPLVDRPIVADFDEQGRLGHEGTPALIDVNAAEYFPAEREYGSPAYSPPELAEAPEEVRDSVRWLPIGVATDLSV